MPDPENPTPDPVDPTTQPTPETTPAENQPAAEKPPTEGPQIGADPATPPEQPQADAPPTETPTPEQPVSGTCKDCGCTEQTPCEGGCAWHDEMKDLCSKCALKRDGNPEINKPALKDGSTAFKGNAGPAKEE